ncbi:T9SS type A sorting domain-containing protein [Botryobacter ruber]|uniref:T9SS type A sorting domain-containing protein n=1 Tax=Botryobacter ruber TaxID=2171629 RepID=UPI000E0AD620|nr:T9SS type A sorting domain-containing protein [Botryobacter ruber]
MKNSYYSKNLLACLFTLALMVAGTITGFAQTMVHVHPVQYGENDYFPRPKNVAPGSENNIIAVFGANINENTTLTSVTVTTAGTYTTADIKNNGFKLWFANSNTFDPSNVAQATLISTQAPVASGNNLVFSGLSQSLDEMGSYFYVTADVAEEATMDRTLSLTATPLSNIVVASGEVMGEPLPATSVQTIGMPLPQINIYGYNYDARNIAPGSARNYLYGFQLNVAEANDVLTSLTLPVKGTVTSADVATNGFRLWYYGSGTDYEDVLAGSASLSENGNVVFSGLNLPLNMNQDGYGGYQFEVTVDLAPGVAAGKTIGIDQFPLSNFTFERARESDVQGSNPMSEGNLSTVVIPDIAIASLGPDAGVVSPGSVNSVLYKLSIAASKANASFTGIRFTTGGTYQASDIARFKLLVGDDEEYESDEVIATADAVASGGEIVFNLTDATMREGENVVLYLVADLAPGAVTGRTIQVQAVAPANITATSGNITGTTSAGGVQTIMLPSVAFTPVGPPAGKVSPGSYAALHTVKVDVTGAPATFQSASFQISGTFQQSDLGYAYDEDGDGIDESVEGLYLVYHKTPNVLNEIDSEEEDQYVALLSYIQSVPNSGETVTFNVIGDDDDTNPTIPLGTGYITVVTAIREDAVLGRTIQLASAGTSGYSFVSGNKSGTTGTGGVQTISAPAITVTAVPTPAGNISIGSQEAVLYKVKLDVTEGTAVLKNLKFTTGGTYEENDISYFELFYSKDAELNLNNDYYLDSKSAVASGGIIEFDDDLEDLQITAGNAAYLFLVARVDGGDSAGRTIFIEPTPATAFTFVAGDVTGTFPLPAGGVQTFAAPTLAVAVPAVAAQNLAGGTNNNLVHKFSVTATGADAYPQSIGVKGLGTYTFEDLTRDGFKVWFNTANSFAGSQLVGSFGTFGNGASVGAGLYDITIKAGTTGYFFITADVSPSAEAGHTMQLEIEDIFFYSGMATLPEDTKSAAHTIAQPAAVPTLAVTYPTLSSSSLQKGVADNVIYRFNVAATDANAKLNYIEFYTDGNYHSSDLAANGLKLWYNTTNSFAGSTLVTTFATDGTEGPVRAALENVQINAGATGYFFITASVSPSAVNNRTIRIDGLYDLQFASGSVQMTGSRGPLFTISAPLAITLDADKNGTLVYPNPYRQQETLTIETNSAHPKLVTIYTATGTVVRTVEMTDTTQVVLSNLSKGLYLVKVQHLKNNQVEVKKLLVQ